MDINDLFLHNELRLPLLPEKNNNEDNIVFLGKVFEKYKNTIREKKRTLKAILKETDIESINKLCDLIIDSINDYYKGIPSEAVEKLMTNPKLSGLIYGLPKKNYAETSTSNIHFYRLRRSEESNPLSRKELFHIPFNLRNKISPQRFSIPGYPCLYLGTSIYICWEELNRPDLSRIQAARFENDKEFTVFNLCYTQYKDIQNNFTSNHKKTLLMSYPIIAACSMKVPPNRQNDPFKLEYIFPQILMQVLLKISDNTDAFGIVYSTTKSYSESVKNEGDFENIVIPTKPIKDLKTKYCENLKEIFKMTKVVTGKPIELLHFNKKLRKDDFQIKKIELNGLPPVDYTQTSFALLEHLLMGKEAKIIENDFEGE